MASFHFNKIFGPIVKPTNIRVVLTMTPTKGWTIRQLNINNTLKECLWNSLKDPLILSHQMWFSNYTNPYLD